MTTSIEEAAALMRMSENEIVEVEDTGDGPVITTFDGTRTIVVPADDPDAEGKVGPMYFVPPVKDYAGSAPVFAPHPPPDKKSSAKKGSDA